MAVPTERITLGREMAKLAVGGFVLTETMHSPSLVLPRHRHEYPNINFTIGGSFRETIGGRPQECVASSLLIKPAGEAHANKYGEKGAHCLIIEISRERLETCSRLSRLFDRPNHIRNSFLASAAMSVYRELQTTGGPSLLLLEGLTLELLAHASKTEPPHGDSRPRWLEDVRGLLHERFAERLSLSLVAQQIGIHPSHLARSFRKYYGCSVGDYIISLRVEYAVRELQRFDFSLSEIATRSGFYDQSQFTNVFKRKTGMTPTEYRRAGSLCNPCTKKRLSSKTS